MKLSPLLAIGCAAALAAPTLRADFTDYDSFFPGGDVNSRTSLSGNFDWKIGGDPADTPIPGFDILGFNPATQTITGVSLAIQVTSASSTLQNVKVDLDGLIINTSFIGGLTFGGTLSPSEVATLIANAQPDGRINYTFSPGDPNSSYTVQYAQMTIQTPDAASTLTLLGMAVAGMGMLRRKFAR